MNPPWKTTGPSDGLQRWARFILRYLIGGAGLIYEIGFDKLRNPTALVVFGGIAGIPDVLGYRAMVRQQAQADEEEHRE